MRTLRFVSELPHALVHECLAQLQCNSFPECRKPVKSTLQRWGMGNGVICTNAETAYYTFRDMLHSEHSNVDVNDVPGIPILNDIRDMFRPSNIFNRLADKVVQKMMEIYGTTSFVSVHLRTEEDFRIACDQWKPRAFEGGKTLKCLQDEKSIYSFLMDSGIPKDSLLFIMTSDTDDVLHGSVCRESNFRCVSKSMLLGADVDYPPQFIKSVNSFAMLDFTIALRATAFFGNAYSTMSVEIYHEFRLIGKSAKFYNERLVTDNYYQYFLGAIRNNKIYKLMQMY